MTKLEAVTMALKIVNECDKHDTEGGSCMNCVFGIRNGDGKSAHCMVSEGNDIPHNWTIKDKLRELL